MRYLDVCLIALSAVSAGLWYVLWVLGWPPRVRRQLAMVAAVAFVATVVAHEIKVMYAPPDDGGLIIGRP